MTSPIITADQRAKEKKGVKGCIFGEFGVGKTSLLWTLPPENTLFFDLEAGDIAVEGWQGDTIRPKNWQECRDFAVLIGGYNDSAKDDQSYSKAHYDAACKKIGDPKIFDKYDTIFIDSITVAGRHCFQWCKNQPETLNSSGKQDLRGAYGLHGRELVAWLTHLQHTRNKNVWFVGILDKKVDEFNRQEFVPQIEGSKAGLELPGIIDQVITMAEIKPENGKSYRAFVTHKFNPYSFPAKDRSGQLDMLEKPHLGELMQKIKSRAKPVCDGLTYEAVPHENSTSEPPVNGQPTSNSKGA